MSVLSPKRIKKITSSALLSNKSWASGLSQISAIEAAILNAEDMPAKIDNDETSSRKFILAGGESGLVVNDSETVKWTGPLPIDSYLLNDDPNPELIVKKSKQNLIYVQEYAIR